MISAAPTPGLEIQPSTISNREDAPICDSQASLGTARHSKLLLHTMSLDRINVQDEAGLFEKIDCQDRRQQALLYIVRWKQASSHQDTTEGGNIGKPGGQRGSRSQETGRLEKQHTSSSKSSSTTDITRAVVDVSFSFLCTALLDACSCIRHSCLLSCSYPCSSFLVPRAEITSLQHEQENVLGLLSRGIVFQCSGAVLMVMEMLSRDGWVGGLVAVC